MGRKGSWFSAVKKALTPESKEKKEERVDPVSSNSRLHIIDNDNEKNRSNSPEPIPNEEVFPEKLTQEEEEEEKEENDHEEIVHKLTTNNKSKEETSAIKIQNSFRGYKARKALKRLRGLVRLKVLVESKSMKRQAMTTLKCMQTLAHVQSEVQMRRIRMTAENLALQKDFQPKLDKTTTTTTTTLPKPKALAVTLNSEEWINSPRSKEQIEARMQNKQDAAIRRERALAYSYSNQQKWKNPSKNETPSILDQKDPHWGWNWLEKWVTDQPACETNANNSSRQLVSSFPKPNNSNNRNPSSNSTSKPPSRAKKQDDHTKRSDIHQRRHSLPGFPSLEDQESSRNRPNHMASPNRKTRSRGPSPLGNVIPENKPISVSRSTTKSLSFPSSSSAHNRNSNYANANAKTTHAKNSNVQ